MRMNKNHKIMMTLIAIAVPLIAISANYQKAIPLSAEPAGIVIDFSVYPESDTIVVEKGRAVQIPLKVEARNDAEKTLQLKIVYDRGNADPTKLQASLSKAGLVLSKLDTANGKVTDLGNGMGLRDAGMLTLTPAATMSAGIYTIGIEVEQQADGKLADALVSGTVVTVEVR